MKWFSFWISIIIVIVLANTTKLPFFKNKDDEIIMYFESIRTEHLNKLFFFFSNIGSIKVLLPLAIIIFIFLLIKKYYLESVFLVVVFWGVRAVNFILKEWFERGRPTFNPLIEAEGYSFPSGHSMNSIVFYGLIYYLFIHILKIGHRYYLLWLCLSLFTVTLIAISRVYLGVHYLSDVIAGACSGYLFGFIMTMFYHNLKSKVE